MNLHHRLILLGTLALAGARSLAGDPQTERQYLSGHGPKDAVPWEFSVTGGRRAGEKTTIPVPSNWELQGFGTYNYGQDSAPKGDEHGLYSLRFNVPDAWKGRRIRVVFDGVMTDATVKINGRPAGATHQGAFYRFGYDITSKVKLGGGADNLLEVDVSKISANADTEGAERTGDYWIFGGIFRPVWLEATPAESIEHTAIDARADGSFAAEVTLGTVRDASAVEAQILDADGKPVGGVFSASVPAGGTGRVRVATQVASPRLWSAETPNLYSVRLALHKGGSVLHSTVERFGFRTFEVRTGQGLFLNGQRIVMKGADRHSFRPETARTLSREDCYDDARLLRSMNMNAVRMSHYPPDEAFLEACDELGLYVLDELSGWHHAHDTEVGRRLVRAMVERDVNHPSILFWDNGNEGGFNRDLDGEFGIYDPQNRRVLHPWEVHDGVDTKHYPRFGELTSRLERSTVLMPTEFLHALYDGGGGAGLEDYWNAILASPVGGGGFIWGFSDEGVVRTDQGGRVDVFSTYAPDGLVGPHHEKEGSYFAVRDIWSPVQITAPTLDEKFDGTLTVTNRYSFTSLAQCRFNWKLERQAGPAAADAKATLVAEGAATSPATAPGATGRLALGLPANWRDADTLAVAALDPAGQEVWTWTWPTPGLAQRLAHPVAEQPAARPAPTVEKIGDELQLKAAGSAVTATFDATSGRLRAASRGGQKSALTDGPRLVFARADAGAPTWLTFSTTDAATGEHRLAEPQLASVAEVDLDNGRKAAWAGCKLEISPDGHRWKTIFDASRRSADGKDYQFPPQPVLAIRVTKTRGSEGQPMAVKTVRLGYSAARFPAEATTPATITTGSDVDANTREPTAWLESRGAAGLDSFRWTMRADGSLRLDYAYTLDGDFIYHGITFDHPEEQMTSLRWLGQGPYRVWQNRQRGTWLGVHSTARNDIQPGETWNYPEFQGCFAGVRWARLATATGPITITKLQPETYLRIGTPRVSHPFTTVLFPAGDLSILHAIPAMGSKFIQAEKSGPASQPAHAAGSYAGSLVFTFDPPSAATP